MTAPILIYFADGPGAGVSPLARLGGLPIAERVLRAAIRAGYARVFVWAPQHHAAICRLAERLSEVASATWVTGDAEEWRARLANVPAAALTVIGPGTVVSPALLEAARHTDGSARQFIEVPAGDEWPASGVFRAVAEDLVDPGAVLAAIQARSVDAMPPGEVVSLGRAQLSLRMRAPADVDRAERILRRSVFKPTDPPLARFNRKLSLPITMALIRTPITANHISIALIVPALWAAWLYAEGSYLAGIWASVISLAASILDGCDGEIARLKYQESNLGCWLDTFGDNLYYLTLFAGLTVGAVRDTGSPLFYAIGALTLVASVITLLLLMLLRQRITNGRPERLQATSKALFRDAERSWTHFLARLATCATRSTMPYGILVLALLDQLPLVIILAAIGANVYWIALAIRLRVLLSGSATPQPVRVE